MEAVILVGIQGAGKSTFCREMFFDTHVRIDLDMLRTRHREKILVAACLEAKQKFVVDNTNLTPGEREKYIAPAKEKDFKVVGYYFQTDLQKAMARNNSREGRARIPDAGLLGAFKRLRLPAFEEGFDELFYVRVIGENQFVVENWRDEIR